MFLLTGLGVDEGGEEDESIQTIDIPHKYDVELLPTGTVSVDWGCGNSGTWPSFFQDPCRTRTSEFVRAAPHTSNIVPSVSSPTH